MNNTGNNTDQRGTMNRHGNGWRINNALVEEVSAENNQTGYLIVSYAVRGQNGTTFIELLRLNINRNTMITNRYGRNIGFRQINPGMWIDAEFSSAWTFSIPPQATAYRIRVQSRIQEPEPPAGPKVTTGQVVKVDIRNSFLYTGKRHDPNRQIRFVVTDQTQILDRRGRRISLRSLSPGQWVQVTHADFMTASIPPQTTAFRIQVL
ncbi:MAG: hypothetical protein ACYCWE_02000 [Eubacteriales bacterium]